MFEAAKSNRISQHIVDQIRNAILEGNLKPGDKLPPEKELSETFQVSRTTLREALRSLEVLGFIEIRKGVSGGAFVVEMEMQKAREYLANFFHFKKLSLENVLEVRLLLESYTAQKAATSLTDEDLQKLGEIIDETDQILKNGTALDHRRNEIEFHRTIGGACKNPILMFILDFVESLLLDIKHILKPEEDFSKRVLLAHKRIYTALKERDSKKARQEMIKDVKQVSRDLMAIQEKMGLGEIDLHDLSHLEG